MVPLVPAGPGISSGACLVSPASAPPCFYSTGALSSIASSMGRLLKIGPGTKSLQRIEGARICVEVDVSKPIPDEIWIGVGDEGMRQQIIPLFVPFFCSGCRKLGHEDQTCRRYKSQAKPASTIPAPQVNDGVSNSLIGYSKGKASELSAEATSGQPRWQLKVQVPCSSVPVLDGGISQKQALDNSPLMQAPDHQAPTGAFGDYNSEAVLNTELSNKQDPAIGFHDSITQEHPPLVEPDPAPPVP